MLTNDKLYGSLKSFMKLLGQDLPIRLAFNLKRTHKELVNYIQSIDEMKKEIETKYKVEGKVPVDNDGKEIENAFYIDNVGVQKLVELMSLEATFKFDKILLEDLMKSNINLSVMDLEILDWLIEGNEQ